MRSSSYWRERAEREKLRSVHDVERELARLERRLKAIESEMRWQLQAISGRIDRMLMGKAEVRVALDAYYRLVEQQLAGSARAAKLLDIAEQRRRWTRLDALLLRVEALSAKVYTTSRDAMERMQAQAAIDGYYRTLFYTEQSLGHGVEFSLINARQVERIALAKYRDDYWENRLWGHVEDMSRKVKDTITKGVTLGSSVDQMSLELQKATGQTRYNVRRLIRTEVMRTHADESAEAFEEAGCDEYTFLATLDLRTSAVCRGLDRKKFRLADRQRGVNFPPMHPHCRSTLLGGYSDDPEEILGSRTARDPITGKTVRVPSDWDYDKWYRERVANDPKALLEEKKIKNRAADRRQFDRMSKVLGKKHIKGIDAFQNAKYADGELWRFYKLDYSRQKSLLDDPSLALPNAQRATIADAKMVKYIFNPENPDGYAKGLAFTSRLGYSIDNWKQLKEELSQGATKYPATFKGNTPHGLKYEQKMVLYGKKGKPANVIVGWMCKDQSTHLTTPYIKEVR